MLTFNKIVTQLGATLTVIFAWINPQGDLNTAAQAALSSSAALVVAIIHLVAAIEKRGANSGPAESGNTSKTSV